MQKITSSLCIMLKQILLPFHRRPNKKYVYIDIRKDVCYTWKSTPFLYTQFSPAIHEASYRSSRVNKIL